MAIQSSPQQQSLIAQALGQMALNPAATGAVAPQGMPFAAGMPGQLPIVPQLIAQSLQQDAPPVNPSQQQPQNPNSADPLAGSGSMLDYLRALRIWKENGMQGPQPQMGQPQQPAQPVQGI